MPRIYFVRHGESMGNVWKDAYKCDDLNFLSPNGILQAKLCGQFFKNSNIKFDRVITSPLQRARHTTMTILQEMDNWKRADIEILPAIKEKGFTEPFESCVGRVDLAMRNVILKGDAECILVVSHYYTTQAIIDCLGIDRSAMSLHFGKTVPNAMPFLFDTRNPTRFELIDYTKYGVQF